MRILFVIPHYFGRGPKAYGSTNTSQRDRRVRSLRACIASLHHSFGFRQDLLLHGGEPRRVNAEIGNHIDVVVCVKQPNHLLEELDLPTGSCRVHSAEVENPRHLGFCCYDVFRAAYGKYDWYCFLEDDIVIRDPLFFCKLQAFYDVTGDARYLLQPNRFEAGIRPETAKAYIDGPLWEDASRLLSELRLPGCKGEVVIPFVNYRFRMAPAENPHAGCFFLTNAHLGHLLEQPWYGQPVVGYAGPLESAASMYIMALFHVFKPADECAAFLEVHHHYQKFLES